MRLDKFLKVSRLIKRRTVAKDACDHGKILINDKVAKAGATVSVDDKITIIFGEKQTTYQVLAIKDNVKKDEAAELYRQC